MNAALLASLKSRLEAVITEYNRLAKLSKYDDLSDLSGQNHQRVTAMARAAIDGVGGGNSPYREHFNEVIAKRNVHGGEIVHQCVGIVEALLHDLNGGYLQSAEELIHGELFSDFLEMSSHLLDEKYKDASAVIAGSTLEGHLRQMCQRNGIAVDVTVAGRTTPKKADLMNAELAKASAYSKLDQKNVTAWLDLRNNAAHGKYDVYTGEQVRLLIDGVRDFITRNPA